MLTRGDRWLAALVGAGSVLCVVITAWVLAGAPLHVLDTIRHYLASCLSATAVAGNMGAGIYWAALAGVCSAVLYPPLRAFIGREWDHLHKKLDHIIEHHPDIPPFPKGRPK